MYCRVTKLRRSGYRIPDGEAPPALEGFLRIRDGVATLAPPMTQNVTLCELFGVSLVQVADGALILRGYEKDEARRAPGVALRAARYAAWLRQDGSPPRQRPY